jgi:hypothetical protein
LSGHQPVPGKFCSAIPDHYGAGVGFRSIIPNKKNDEWLCGERATASTTILISDQSYPAQQFQLVLPVPEKKPPVVALSYVLSIGVEIEVPHAKTRELFKTGFSKIIDGIAAEV